MADSRPREGDEAWLMVQRKLVMQQANRFHTSMQKLFWKLNEVHDALGSLEAMVKAMAFTAKLWPASPGEAQASGSSVPIQSRQGGQGVEESAQAREAYRDATTHPSEPPGQMAFAFVKEVKE